jgi:hypothetical protein
MKISVLSVLRRNAVMFRHWEGRYKIVDVTHIHTYIRQLCRVRKAMAPVRSFMGHTVRVTLQKLQQASPGRGVWKQIDLCVLVLSYPPVGVISRCKIGLLITQLYFIFGARFYWLIPCFFTSERWNLFTLLCNIHREYIETDKREEDLFYENIVE